MPASTTTATKFYARDRGQWRMKPQGNRSQLDLFDSEGDQATLEEFFRDTVERVVLHMPKNWRDALPYIHCETVDYGPEEPVTVNLPTHLLTWSDWVLEECVRFNPTLRYRRPDGIAAWCWSPEVR